MLKKFPWKTVILTLLAWSLFWEITETIQGKRMFLPVRWLYSDMGHAKDIEVLTYLLTDEQVAHMLAYPHEDVKQPNKNAIRSRNVNVVLRLRNRTGGLAYGRLLWRMPGMEWSAVDVHDIPVPGKTEKYGDIVLSMGIVPFERDDALPPPIEVKWEKLYVYR